MANVMITTIDNPFNPFKQFDDWLNHDLKHGTDTCGKLARIAKTSNALSDSLNDEEIEQAMDSLIETCPGFFVKLYENTADQTIKEFTNVV